MEYIIVSKGFNSEQLDYSAIVITTIPETPTTLLEKIGIDLNYKEINGQILIDSLLYSGNNSERFIKVNFINGDFVKDSFEYISIPRGSFERKLSSDYLRSKIEILYSSCLTEIQKKLILKGCNL